MTPKDVATVETQVAMKRWLDTWRTVGPLLEQERADRLTAMSPQDVQDATRSLLDLWRPEWSGDEGEGLLVQQRVFARARTRG